MTAFAFAPVARFATFVKDNTFTAVTGAILTVAIATPLVVFAGPSAVAVAHGVKAQAGICAAAETTHALTDSNESFDAKYIYC